MEAKKIVIVMPAYNAGKQIISVFERIPLEIWNRLSGIVLIQDGSTDDTHEKVKLLQSRYGTKLIVLDKTTNEGYAKGQKDGFLLAMKLRAEIVVLLHADGQYAPELLPYLLRPLEEGTADIVQGSRMADRKGARKGGMPLYKFISNILLSTLENWVYGLHFSEYHSGYMLYSRKALETIPFLKLSNTFHFDGEMLFVGAKKKLRIAEIPIPTTYGEERSNVKPIQYGFHVLGIMIKYLQGKYNF